MAEGVRFRDSRVHASGISGGSPYICPVQSGSGFYGGNLQLAEGRRGIGREKSSGRSRSSDFRIRLSGGAVSISEGLDPGSGCQFCSGRTGCFSLCRRSDSGCVRSARREKPGSGRSSEGNRTGDSP